MTSKHGHPKVNFSVGRLRYLLYPPNSKQVYRLLKSGTSEPIDFLDNNTLILLFISLIVLFVAGSRDYQRRIGGEQNLEMKRQERKAENWILMHFNFK